MPFDDAPVLQDGFLALGAIKEILLDNQLHGVVPLPEVVGQINVPGHGPPRGRFLDMIV